MSNVNKRMRALQTTVQTHRHTSTCCKKSAACKFNFPRDWQNHDLEMTCDPTGSLAYMLFTATYTTANPDYNAQLAVLTAVEEEEERSTSERAHGRGA